MPQANSVYSMPCPVAPLAEIARGLISRCQSADARGDLAAWSASSDELMDVESAALHLVPTSREGLLYLILLVRGELEDMPPKVKRALDALVVGLALHIADPLAAHYVINTLPPERLAH